MLLTSVGLKYQLQTHRFISCHVVSRKLMTVVWVTALVRSMFSIEPVAESRVVFTSSIAVDCSVNALSTSFTFTQISSSFLCSSKMLDNIALCLRWPFLSNAETSCLELSYYKFKERPKSCIHYLHA